jgi:hypothetical protein
MPYELSAVIMARNSETLVLKPFAMTWVTRDRLVARVGVGTPPARGCHGAAVLWPLRLGTPAGCWSR